MNGHHTQWQHERKGDGRQQNHTIQGMRGFAGQQQLVEQIEDSYQDCHFQVIGNQVYYHHGESIRCFLLFWISTLQYS